MIGPITGILAANSPINRQYFTTVLYPYAVTDDLSIGNAVIQRGTLWEYATEDATLGNPTITTGTLVETIVYKTYNDWITEDAALGNPTIISGTLT